MINSYYEEAILALPFQIQVLETELGLLVWVPITYLASPIKQITLSKDFSLCCNELFSSFYKMANTK